MEGNVLGPFREHSVNILPALGQSRAVSGQQLRRGGAAPGHLVLAGTFRLS
jgi:hypothetical protein